MAESQIDDKSLKNRRPWDVVERDSSSRPPNELRYSGAIRLVAISLVLSIAALFLALPAVERQQEFRDIVAHAEEAGFPQVPPTSMTDERRGKFISDWNISCDELIDGIPHCSYVTEFSDLRFAYEEDHGLFFIGVLATLLSALVLIAIASSRMLNNLYALGYEMSYIPPAWAYAGFLIPILNMFLPWLVVSRIWKAAWTGNGRQPSKAIVAVSSVWGAMAAVTVFLNPWVTSWILRRSDIDGWLLHLQWVSNATIWVVIAAIITSLLLTVVALRQRARYRYLETAVYA